MERTGTATLCGGVVRPRWNTLAPRRCRARSASCTFTGRLWDSDSTAAVSPSVTPQSRNVSANASIHFPSTRSTSTTSLPPPRNDGGWNEVWRTCPASL